MGTRHVQGFLGQLAPRLKRSAGAGGRLAISIGLVLSVAGGCADDFVQRPVICHAGDTRACLGPGACEGAQQCALNGQGFDACECGDGDGKGGQGAESNGGGGAGITSDNGGMSGDLAGAPGISGAGGSGSVVEGGGGQGGTSSPTYECTPIGNVGCSATQNCSLEGTEPECVPVGTKGQWAACTTLADCASGFICYGHQCVRACTETADCKTADTSIECGIRYEDPKVGLIGGCFKSCDILAQDCAGAQNCYLGVCLTPVKTETEGKLCTSTADCARGLDCTGSPYAEDSRPRCNKYCSMAEEAPCGENADCYPLNDQYPDLPANWGICFPH